MDGLSDLSVEEISPVIESQVGTQSVDQFSSGCLSLTESLVLLMDDVVCDGQLSVEYC